MSNFSKAINVIQSNLEIKESYEHIDQDVLTTINKQIGDYFDVEDVYCQIDDETNTLHNLFGYPFTLKLPKNPKKLTFNWIINALSKKELIKSKRKSKTVDAVSKIKDKFDSLGIIKSNVYPTSFGFSVDNLFGDGLDEARKMISDLDIEYKKMEYSDANWVVRVYL